MNQQRVISMTLRAALGAALLVAALSGCGKQAATEPVDTAVTVETAEAAVRGAESQYQSALESYGGEPWDETRSLSVLEEQVRLARENYDNMPLGQALVEAGMTRLRPILMTTLTTAISMLPMIFSSNSGMSMMKDMAYIVIGGLIASTVLALFLMPAFYLLIRGERIEA